MNERKNQNAEILERDEISTYGRSRNDIREQSYDPESVYQRLANSQNDSSKGNGIRSGSSGWIGSSEGNSTVILRLGEGLLRDLRDRGLSGYQGARIKTAKALFP